MLGEYSTSSCNFLECTLFLPFSLLVEGGGEVFWGKVVGVFFFQGEATRDLLCSQSMFIRCAKKKHFRKMGNFFCWGGKEWGRGKGVRIFFSVKK